MYRLVERFVGPLSRSMLVGRFVFVQMMLRRRLSPVVVCDIITKYAFRPSEVLGRRKYTYEIIFHHMALRHVKGLWR